VLLVVADDAVGRIAHVADLTAVDGFHAARTEATFS
jgi:hypothetical protein